MASQTVIVRYNGGSDYVEEVGGDHRWYSLFHAVKEKSKQITYNVLEDGFADCYSTIQWWQ